MVIKLFRRSSSRFSWLNCKKWFCFSIITLSYPAFAFPLSAASLALLDPSEDDCNILSSLELMSLLTQFHQIVHFVVVFSLICCHSIVVVVTDYTTAITIGSVLREAGPPCQWLISLGSSMRHVIHHTIDKVLTMLQLYIWRHQREETGCCGTRTESARLIRISMDAMLS